MRKRPGRGKRRRSFPNGAAHRIYRRRHDGGGAHRRRAQRGVATADRVIASDVSAPRRREVERRFGIRTTERNAGGGRSRRRLGAGGETPACCGGIGRDRPGFERRQDRRLHHGGRRHGDDRGGAGSGRAGGPGDAQPAVCRRRRRRGHRFRAVPRARMRPIRLPGSCVRPDGPSLWTNR